MRLFTKRKGRMLRKPLSVGNVVYFVKNGLPHTGEISAIGSEKYTVENIHGLFMNWDDDIMNIPKNDCIGTQEIFIPKFPSKEIVNAYKNMGELALQYENFPKRQVLNYGVVDGFNELIPFIPGKMIFELTNGVKYLYKSYQTYGNLLVTSKDIVIPIWMHHSNNTDIEAIVKGKLERATPLPQVATELQIEKIYTIDKSDYQDYSDISMVPENHIQLIYKKENMPYHKISVKEIIDKLPNPCPSEYEIDKHMMGFDENE